MDERKEALLQKVKDKGINGLGILEDLDDLVKIQESFAAVELSDEGFLSYELYRIGHGFYKLYQITQKGEDYLLKKGLRVRKFKKKPVVVEAIQYNQLNKDEIELFVGKKLRSELESETAYLAGKGATQFSLIIETKEGDMKAFNGDWIIKEPFPTGDRDFYPCKNSIFKETYIELNEQK